METPRVEEYTSLKDFNAATEISRQPLTDEIKQLFMTDLEESCDRPNNLPFYYSFTTGSTGNREGTVHTRESYQTRYVLLYSAARYCVRVCPAPARGGTAYQAISVAFDHLTLYRY